MTSSSGSGPRLPPPPAPEWRLAPEPEVEVVARLGAELSLPSPLCRILAARGITEPADARDFLRPRLEHLHPPEGLADAVKAADRILAAVARAETVLVHGDYDVDGICAAALLTRWIERLGGSAVAFVPHRLRDGYDLGEAGLRRAREAGASLLVTCDSGIRAHEAVARARDARIDVIVTDHHTPGESLPPALAVVDPLRSDCPYPEKALCGTAVVFKLCELLGRKAGVPRDELLAHLDLVALATVADLVPLTGENRVLVRFGLRWLAGTRKPGLRALIEVAGLEGEGLTAGRVGFQLAPRINAGGRVGEAEVPLRLLLTEDAREAAELAGRLDGENRRRREVDRATLEEALEVLARDFDPARDLGVVIAGEGWHPGVIGIVASRVVERIHRPAVLISLDGERGRGSARSVPELHLFEALSDCREHFLRFGGHRQAAGMDLERGRLPAFRADFNEAVRRHLEGRVPRPVLRADAPLALEEADADLHRLLEYVGPFGIGNPRPVFWARDLRTTGRPRTVGRNHLKLRLRGGGGEVEAIGFGLSDRVPPATLETGPLEALFQLRENEYRGVVSVQAHLLDIRTFAEPARRREQA